MGGAFGGQRHVLSLGNDAQPPRRSPRSTFSSDDFTTASTTSDLTWSKFRDAASAKASCGSGFKNAHDWDDLDLPFFNACTEICLASSINQSRDTRTQGVRSDCCIHSLVM